MKENDREEALKLNLHRDIQFINPINLSVVSKLEAIQAIQTTIPQDTYKNIAYALPQVAYGENEYRSESIELSEFKQGLHDLGTALYPNSLDYFGTRDLLCMNYAVIGANYFSYRWNIPVVGGLVEEFREEGKPGILPVTSIFDYQGHDTHKIMFEDSIVVNIGNNQTFLVDYNLWYDRPFVTEIKDDSHLGNLGEETGMWVTQTSSFDINTCPDVVQEAWQSPLDQKFLFMVGHPDTWERYKKQVQMKKSDPTVDYRKMREIFFGEQGVISGKEYVQTLSANTLIENGNHIQDLSGRGRIYLIPNSAQERAVLQHIPNSG